MPSRNAPIPRLAIVGRPNVGKSSLMNMLATRKVSIVDDTAGTTRDRVSAIVSIEGPDPAVPPVMVEMTDTGGYGVYTVEGRRIDDAGHDLAGLTKDIEQQIGLAVQKADLILLVIDAQAGITPQDEEVARLLREGGLGALSKPGEKKHPVKGGAPTGHVVVIANKVDGPRWEMHGLEASGLGFGEPLMVGAKNNYRRREFTETIYEIVKTWQKAKKKSEKAKGDDEADDGAPGKSGIPEMHVAIVGKRNAGKSTLVNRLAGEERVIVSEIPGTTRDAVDVRFEMDGKVMVAIDTAGLRKKKSFQDRIEWYALDRLQLAVQRCDVAMLLVDATEPVSQVDQHVAQMLTASYKPVVIVVTKWDLVHGKLMPGAKKGGPRVAPGMYEDYLRKELKGLWYAPISFVSGQTGHNVRETVDLAFEMMQQSRMRVGTGKLNRLLQHIIEKQGPTSKLGTFAKVFYCSQVETAPPTIVCVVNRPQLFTPNYQRFLLNRFREELPFTEVPIKLIIRARKQNETFEEAEAAAASAAGGAGRAGRAGTKGRTRRDERTPAGSRFKSGAEFFKD